MRIVIDSSVYDIVEIFIDNNFTEGTSEISLQLVCNGDIKILRKTLSTTIGQYDFDKP